MSREFFDTAERALNAESGEETVWGNFGYWRQARRYPDAAEALARLLADSVELSAQDRVLDLGFGMGEQLRLWHTAYGVRQLLGFNPSASQAAIASQRLAAAEFTLRQAPAEALIEMPRPGRFDKILALDCAYHFTRRPQLFQHLAGCLQPGGRMGWTDLYLPRAASGAQWLALRALCSATRIPRSNLMTETDYRQMLATAGLQLESFSDLSGDVFGPFARWWQRVGRWLRMPARDRLKFAATAAVLDRLSRHRGVLAYALITARPAA